MKSNSPSRCKTNTMRTKRFEPYSRPWRRNKPSSNSTTAPLTRKLAIYFDEPEAQEALTVPNDVWMGSAMSIDPPSNHPGVGPLGSALDMEIDVVASEVRTLAVALSADTWKVEVAHDNIADNQAIERLSPRKRKLVRRLQNAVNKCIKRHCKMGHPTTDVLRKRIDTALQGALAGVMVEEIMLSCDLKGASPAKTGDSIKQHCISTIDDYFILPTVAHVFSRVKRGLMSLGTALNTKSEASGMMYGAGSPPHIPGEYPIAGETE